MSWMLARVATSKATCLILRPVTMGAEPIVLVGANFSSPPQPSSRHCSGAASAFHTTKLCTDLASERHRGEAFCPAESTPYCAL